MQPQEREHALTFEEGSWSLGRSLMRSGGGSCRLPDGSVGRSIVGRRGAGAGGGDRRRRQATGGAAHTHTHSHKKKGNGNHG